MLWGSRATDFDAEGAHSIGQEAPVVAIFVGMLLKSYKGEFIVLSTSFICKICYSSISHLHFYYTAESTLSGGSSCKWYINEEIPAIEKFFDKYCSPTIHNSYCVASVQM